MTVDSKLVAITTIVYCINGVGKGTWWGSTQKQSA